jgi:major outer membrane protein
MRQGTTLVLTLFLLALTTPFLPAQQAAELPESGPAKPPTPVAPSDKQPEATLAAQPVVASAGPVDQPSATPTNTEPIIPPVLASGATAPQNGPTNGLMAGGTFYFIRPYLQNNTAYVTTIGPGQPTSQVISQPFGWDFQPAFAGWIGWTGSSGLGIRSRYFTFSERSETASLTNDITPPPQTQTTINPPLANFLPLSSGGSTFGSPGTLLNTGFGTDHLTFVSDMRIQTIDLEVTYRMNTCFGLFQAFGGGRYLNLVQGYHATLINTGGGAPISEMQSFDASRSFQGGGPTLGLEWDLPIRKTGFSLYANARGSLLVGRSTENVSFAQTINDPNGLLPGHVVPPAVLYINPVSSRSSDSVIPTAEVELGFEYGHRVGRAWIFFRGAAVSQTYFDAGNASQSTGNFSLFGAQATVGIAY